VKLALFDYDDYNNYNNDYNIIFKQVYNCHKKAGYAFVLAMILEGGLEVVDGRVIGHIGVLDIEDGDLSK